MTPREGGIPGYSFASFDAVRCPARGFPPGWAGVSRGPFFCDELELYPGGMKAAAVGKILPCFVKISA